MRGQDLQTKATDRRRPTGGVLREAVLVAVAGGVLALIANQLSPRGLTLTRNYFPDGVGNAMRAVAGTSTNTATPASSTPLVVSGESSEWLWINGDQAVRLFHDSHLKPGVLVFIDARDEEHYVGGHIPGAYEFDPYHPEKYFPTVLPACRAAEQIVVYCNGGDCDDSKTAAQLLKDVGIPYRKLFIYGGGITDWGNNHQPVETGARNSGNLSIAIQ
jgi:rhodanese-related sulfurtransferase